MINACTVMYQSGEGNDMTKTDSDQNEGLAVGI